MTIGDIIYVGLNANDISNAPTCSANFISIKQVASDIGTTGPTGPTGTGNLQTVLTAGNSATGSIATIGLTNNGVGSTSNPQLILNNSNATAGSNNGVPSIEFYKSGRTGAAGDIISSQNFYSNNYLGTKIEFAKIESSIRNTAAGNDDGSIGFSGIINGAMTEFFRVNGADSENNCFLPLDMNGQSIKSSSGNMTIQASAGDLNLQVPSGASGVNGNILIETSVNNATQRGTIDIKTTGAGGSAAASFGDINISAIPSSGISGNINILANPSGLGAGSVNITSKATTGSITLSSGVSSPRLIVNTNGVQETLLTTQGTATYTASTTLNLVSTVAAPFPTIYLNTITFSGSAVAQTISVITATNMPLNGIYYCYITNNNTAAGAITVNASLTTPGGTIRTTYTSNVVIPISGFAFGTLTKVGATTFIWSISLAA